MKERTIARLVAALRAHKRRRLERKMGKAVRSNVPDATRGVEQIEKRKDAVPASDGSARQRARWRSFRRRSLPEDTSRSGLRAV